MSYFFDPSEVKRKELAPGVTLRVMWGDKIMMSVVEIAPGAVVPNHAHPPPAVFGLPMHHKFTTDRAPSRKTKFWDIRNV